MQFVSLKSAICQTFAKSAVSGYPMGNRITFLTPLGCVSGIPVLDKSEQQDSQVKAYQDLLAAADAAFVENWHKTGASTAPHDGYVLLRDVTIRPFGDTSVTKKDALVLFTGNVSGVLLGSEPE